ncbi:SH3 domain-containing protein [Sulfurimonas sp. MAG313]|nr:SH3 domain-containing C40 family peptidase [Sulfurimonas sp. MAG313]MDF1881021.1 SH3 domain-containing protein [Sulfurimonas sp. MAG313]
MKVSHFIILSLGVLYLNACATKVENEFSLFEVDPTKPEIQDLIDFPQISSPYLANLSSRTVYVPIQSAYDKKYFEPWNYTKPPFDKKSILWPFSSYTYDKSFGENLKPLPKEWFAHMKRIGNYENYASLNKKAISLQYLNLRNFPTSKPVLKNPNIAGEGFPFDYVQNSGIHANEPLFVSHLSIDGNWAYVFTAYATGWVKKNNLSFIKDTVASHWQEARQIELLDEHYAIKDLQGNFIFNSRVGVRLPLISVEKYFYIALAISSGKNGSAIYKSVKIPKNIAQEGKLLLNHKNIEGIMNLMLKSHYGWGGLYEERDCSSMLRDLYAPFGIWLPRNSSQQAKVGKIISLKDLSLEDKKKVILAEGVPFETLLHKKGHILLYLGEYNGEITVLHNIWGVKTIKDGIEGRKVIGRVVISSLELGKERKDYNQDRGILSGLDSMNIITQEADRPLILSDNI